MPTDYSKSKIYKIVCNETGETYYGSTVQPLVKRLAEHKKNINKCETSKIILRGNYNIILCQECPCENREQLYAIERKYIEENECINKNKPVINTQEDILRKQREYRKNNKELIAKKDAEYYQKNKEKILLQKKQYHKENKETIRKQKKQYREENKEEIQRKAKEYREKNKEEIQRKNKEYKEKNKEELRRKDAEYRARKKASIEDTSAIVPMVI